jgi:hypothetical protein
VRRDNAFALVEFDIKTYLFQERGHDFGEGNAWLNAADHVYIIHIRRHSRSGKGGVYLLKSRHGSLQDWLEAEAERNSTQWVTLPRACGRQDVYTTGEADNGRAAIHRVEKGVEGGDEVLAASEEVLTRVAVESVADINP